MGVEFFSDISRALAKTEAGRSLKEILRWSEYRTGESEQEWISKIGITGQDFLHTTTLMPQIGEVFLRLEGDRFSSSEQETFRYGLISHDFGEAKINGKGIGDISASIKNAKDEKIESGIARKVIASLDLPKETKDKLLNGYHEVVEGGNPKLYDAFKALERTEYVITAMKAFVNCRRLEIQGKPGIKEEKAMIGRVLVINLTKVLNEHVPNYPNSIGRLFSNNRELIDQMFDFSTEWLVSNNSWRGKDVDHGALAMMFQSQWIKFKIRTDRNIFPQDI
ncbi:MAG: hypothetical protein HYV90_05395 [Candidatus Woesebacteria bacterium]|nr:MAG: hypothetical protein HYV90_05395 [Candidatus Woesebacteria bacterium]